MTLPAVTGSLVAVAATATPSHAIQVPLWIDLAAVVVGALAGAAVAARERFDIVGVLLLAVVMGLGGGIIRDLLLGLRPVAVTSSYYLPVAAAAALAGFLFASLMRRFTTIMVVLDALSVALFAVVGVEKALLYHLPYVSAIFIGVAAAVGGGLFVDLIAGLPVEIIRQGPWNALAALAGAIVYAVTAAVGATTAVSQIAAFVVAAGARLASLHWGLQSPVPADVGKNLRFRRQPGSDDGAAGPDDDNSGPGS